MLLYVCLSSHGYGHGSRTASVLMELAALRPSWRIVLSTALPQAFLSLALAGVAVERRSCRWDVGVIQADALAVDPAATLTALETLERELPGQLERERSWLLAQRQPLLILADVPPSAALLADAVGAPLVWLASFGWEAIYGAMGPAFAPWTARCLDLYRRGDLRLECPLAMPMPWGQRALSLGLTTARPRLPLAPLAERLRLPLGRAGLVLVSFGGLGLSIDPELFRRWPDHLFIGPEPALADLPNGRVLPEGVRPLDLMPLVERLITKPGYSSFCEALSQQVGIHLVRRHGFAEAAVLETALQEHGWHRVLDQSAFLQGDWQLDQPLLPPRRAPLGSDGAVQAARALIQCTEQGSDIPINAARPI